MSRKRRWISDATITLTPMIDVMTVLLAVFMVTTPMMTNGIDLELPNAGTTVLTGTDHAMQVSVDSAGRYYLGTVELPADEVVTRAVAMRGENPNLTIVINGDTHADYGAVMNVMGKLKTAGFQKIGLRTKLEK
ncbi:MAG: biopolymer transporter ExbD [Alphaproteobacteria bacterium]|nr:biopolymer transporter ExbD [Alphaproteobacteria bacterium]